MHPTKVQSEILALRESLLGLIRSRGIGEADAEDILQESLLKALRGADDLRDEDRLTSWTYQIVRNAITDHFRTSGREVAVEHLPEEPSQDEFRMICRCVEDVIPTLPGPQADLIRFVEIENEPTTSAAARLGITRNALKVRLHRARAELRRRLEETCRTCAKHGCLDCACRAPVRS